VRGYNRPSQGLRPLWRVEPDLERDRDSHQYATQHNDPERGHCPWPFGFRVRAVQLGRGRNRGRWGAKITSAPEWTYDQGPQAPLGTRGAGYRDVGWR
jgi:hypothetical protein